MSCAQESSDTGMRHGAQRSIAIACVLAALSLVVLDAATVNVALPALAQALRVAPAASVRVITAYQLGLVVALLPCAALGESRGYRSVYRTGLALFVGSSALCAYAPSLDALVAARFVQGLGGAAVMSLGIALLRSILAPQQFATAISWNAVVVALSSAAGPALGALALSTLGWRWLFAINVPFGVLVLLATQLLPDEPGTRRPVDVVSVALNAAAFGMSALGAELVPTAPGVAATLGVAGALSLTTLIRRELPKKAPLVPIDLLRQRAFRISAAASVCCFVGQSAALVSLPFYLQHDLGQDALRTGGVITAWPLGVAAVAPIAGRLATPTSSAWLCALGAGVLSLALAGAALWPLHGEPMALVPFTLLAGVGFGLFQVPNNRIMFMRTPHRRSGAAGGVQSTARLAGQTVGGLVVTLLLALVSADRAPRIGLCIGAMSTMVAALVSVLRRDDQRPTDTE